MYFFWSVGHLGELTVSSKIQFFAHLVTMRVVAPASLLAVLRSFTTVLDEPGVSYSRARQAGLCAGTCAPTLRCHDHSPDYRPLVFSGEGVLRAGVALHAQDAAGVTDIITALKTFSDLSSQARSLVAPLVRSHDQLQNVAKELPDCKEVRR